MEERSIKAEEIDFDTRIPAGTGIIVVGSSGEGEGEREKVMEKKMRWKTKRIPFVFYLRYWKKLSDIKFYRGFGSLL